jgi:hypothetical protein
MSLAVEWWDDRPGEPRCCTVCGARWTATPLEPRLFVGADYVGHACLSCLEASPEVMLDRLRTSGLPDARETVTTLEALEQHLETLSADMPRRRRQAFRIMQGGR